MRRGLRFQRDSKDYEPSVFRQARRERRKRNPRRVDATHQAYGTGVVSGFPFSTTYVTTAVTAPVP